MRRLDRIMVCLYLLVAVVPFAVMEYGIKDHPIFGAVPPAPRPKLSFSDFVDETYQKAYTAWFESKLGFKGYEVTTDNAILLHAFHETKVGSPVVLGRDGILFKDEDLAYYNKSGADLPTQQRVDAFADRLAALQLKLQAQHRALVPVIIPSKTSIFREYIPPRWTRDLGEPRPSDTAVYAAFVAALDARHVTYVDGRRLFTTGGAERTLLWTKEARHWSTYGACLAMGEVVRRYDALTGDTLPPDPCAVKLKWQPRTFVDYDLWNLLNSWLPPHRTKNVPAVDYAWPPAGQRKPSMLAVGTSFSWQIIYYGTDSHLFDKVWMDYYNRTLVEWPANIHTEVHPHSKEWDEVFLGRDLYVLDLLETYLLAPDTYADEFLAQLDEALTQGAPPPVPKAMSGATITLINDLGLTNREHYFELWGSFPHPEASYTAIITCDGVAHPAMVYYQNPNGQQLNVKVADPGPGACDRTLIPARALGVSCTFHVEQGDAIGTPLFGPRRVCPGPQGSSGQDDNGNCLPGLAGC